MNRLELLEDIKIDLEITDDLQNDVLNGLIQQVLAHFYFEYENEPLKKHQFIIQEVAVKRYNRRGAEGAKSKSIEGYSVTYEDDERDFDKYDHILRQDFDLISRGTGGIKFL